MARIVICLILYIVVCHVVYRRSKLGLNDPVVMCLLGGGLTIITQFFGSDIIWQDFTSEALIFAILLCIFFLGLTIIRPVRLAPNCLPNDNDRFIAYITLGIGYLSFIYLIYLIGGLQVYLRKTEEYNVLWEGPVAAVAFLTSLAEFSAFLFLSISAHHRQRKLFLVLSLIAILPTAMEALLNFRRTPLFVLSIYFLFFLQLKNGILPVRRILLASLVAIPFLTVTVLQGVPYLRTLFFVDIAVRQQMSYDDYIGLTKFNETGLGVLLTGALSAPCGELGYGRRVISETARVFIPKATGLKEPMLAALAFDDIRNCTPIELPPSSFVTGLGEAMLDFGYLSPAFLLLCIWITIRTTRLVSNGAQSAYVAYMSAYFPLIILYGPVFILTKLVPIILISSVIKLKLTR